jgi:hypothetical protein
MFINSTKEQIQQQQHILKHYCSQQRAQLHLLNSSSKKDITWHIMCYLRQMCSKVIRPVATNYITLHFIAVLDQFYVLFENIHIMNCVYRSGLKWKTLHITETGSISVLRTKIRFKPTNLSRLSTSGLQKKKANCVRTLFCFLKSRPIPSWQNVVTCFQLRSMDKVRTRNNCKCFNTSSESYSIPRIMPHNVFETARKAR